MSRLYVGLPPTKLLLRFTEQLLAQHIVSVETMFPSQALLGAVCIIYVSRVITYSRVWINRVSLPILLVVRACNDDVPKIKTGKSKIKNQKSKFDLEKNTANT